MAILLVLLFTFMANFGRIEKKMEESRIAILERQNLQIRLQDLFSSISRSPLYPSFYTQPFPKEEADSLVILFDNGVDPDPEFSGTLLGRIFLDEKNNLTLASWPLDPGKNRPWRKEILLRSAKRFSFRFLGERTQADPKIAPAGPRAGWHLRWPKERNDLPSIVRLMIEQNQTPLQYSFRLPTSHPIATYWEGGNR